MTLDAQKLVQVNETLTCQRYRLLIFENQYEFIENQYLNPIIILTDDEFLTKTSTISNLLARSALVCSTFFIFVASSVTGNRQGVNTIARLRSSILFEAEACATSLRNRITQVSVAECNGGNKRHAVKMASIFDSPVILLHLQIE